MVKEAPEADIVCVEVRNSAIDITFRFTLDGSVVGPGNDGQKYILGIDSSPGGDPEGNPWNRQIRMSSGMDYWIGCWLDQGGGGQVWRWHDASCDKHGIPQVLAADRTVEVTFPLALIGCSGGDSFDFEAFTTGPNPNPWSPAEPDSAFDALSLPTQTVPTFLELYDAGTNVAAYVVQPVGVR